MKNGKRAVSFILAVVLLCTSFAGCGMVQQDKAYLEQVAAAVTETQSILKDVEAAADELSGQSSIVYENSVNAEGFDVLDEYYTLCTEKLNALNDAVGAVRQQMQSLERCDAPKTEKGKALNGAEWTSTRRFRFHTQQQSLAVKRVSRHCTEMWSAKSRKEHSPAVSSVCAARAWYR